MLLGPLFQVEMVTVARRGRYFALRVVYGALALMLLWIAYESTRYTSLYGTGRVSHRQNAQLAAQFFLSYTWLQILAILAVGPAMAVGTIATERERRTIEYLFVSDLSDAEIVLGKLVARLCLLGQLVLVGLPILFLFRLLGGIPAQLLVMSFLLSASTAMLIVGLSICVSVWSARSRDATVRVYLLLAVVIIIPLIFASIGLPLLGAAGGWQQYLRNLLELLMSLNPIWTLGMAMSNSSALGANIDLPAIWRAIAGQLVVATGAIGLAVFAVRRVHLKETTKAADEQSRSRRSRLQLPRWRRPLRENAMLWKEVFAATSITKLGMLGQISRAIIVASVFVFMLSQLFELFQRNWRVENFMQYLAGLNGMLGTAILLQLAARAAGLITTEKERDCWLSLISTPLTAEEIVRGKIWGNLYSVRWALGLMLLNWGVGVLLDPLFLLPTLVLLTTFLLLCWYVTNLGLCFSLQSPTTLRAMGGTLGTLVFTGGGYLFCCCAVMVGGGGGGGDEALIMFAPCIPFLLIFPVLAYLEATQANFGGIEETMSVAYAIGIIGYVIAAWILYSYLIGNFERLAGRTQSVPDALGITQSPGTTTSAS